MTQRTSRRYPVAEAEAAVEVVAAVAAVVASVAISGALVHLANIYPTIQRSLLVLDPVTLRILIIPPQSAIIPTRSLFYRALCWLVIQVRFNSNLFILISFLALKRYMDFGILKNRFFFIIFYIIVQHVKNIFPKFQVNRNKILGERFLKSPPIRILMSCLLVWTRFSQNCIFEVDGHDFSRINAPILLKFCTLLLDKID